MKHINKKGQIMQQLGGLAVGIAALTIVMVITFIIISQGRSQIVDMEGGTGACGNISHVYNGTQCCEPGTSQTALCGGINTSGTNEAYNVTHTLGSAVETIPGWVPLIVIAVIGSIILGVVMLFRNR